MPADMAANVTALHAWLYGDSGYSVSTTAVRSAKQSLMKPAWHQQAKIDIEQAVSEVTTESTESASETGNGTEEDSSDVKTITTPPEV